jgi:hypothetical protein
MEANGEADQGKNEKAVCQSEHQDEERCPFQAQNSKPRKIDAQYDQDARLQYQGYESYGQIIDLVSLFFLAGPGSGHLSYPLVYHLMMHIR